MGRSLEQQLTYPVRQSFKERVQKHSLKGTKDWHSQGRSFSYQTMQNRLDSAKQFSKFMKENYPDVKMAVEVRTDHFNEFLRFKAENCTKATLERYASDMRALTREISVTYSRGRNFSHEIKTPQADHDGVRSACGVTNDVVNQVYKATKNDNLKMGITLGTTFGLRSEGIVTVKQSDVFRNDAGKVCCHVTEKGGRERTVTALNDKMGENALKMAQNRSEGVLVPIQARSLEKALNRQMNALGLRSVGHNGAFHDIRKGFAQNLYDKCRAEGMSKRETIQYVNVQLGHSAERDSDLLSHYVADMH